MTAQTPLPHDTDFSLHVGEHFFLLRGGRDVEKWATAINLHEWLIYHPQTQQTEGPIEWRKLPALAASRDLDPRATVLFPSGSNMGFYLWQLSPFSATRRCFEFFSGGVLRICWGFRWWQSPNGV